MTNYPTAWQRRVLWAVATYLAIAVGAVVAVELLSYFGQAVGFLQPVLIPFAIAAVLAYLLNPIVRILTARTRLSRTWAVIVVFAIGLLTVTLLGALVVPRLYNSTVNMIWGLPAYTQKAQARLTHLLDVSEAKLDKLNNLFPSSTPAPEDSPGVDPATAPPEQAYLSPAPAPTPPPTPAPTPETYSSMYGDGSDDEPLAATQAGSQLAGDDALAPAEQPREAPSQPKTDETKPTVKELLAPHGIRNYIQKQLPSLEARLPALLDSLLHLLLKGFSVAALLIDAVIIPVYLFFLLVEAHNIARHWNEYLPIRDSPFKKEVVSVLLEINGYLVAFFRGQLIVSTIDGIIIGSCLAFFVGLDFSFLIGLLVVVLTFIPYLGFILCYVPAVLIAIVQFGDWYHPALVVFIMFVAQTLESTIISPKIVGDSVGLHPVTVILSVFGWSLLLNGPIGAILAVPLSATVKVLLRRYIWEKGGRGRRLVPSSAISLAALKEGEHPRQAASDAIAVKAGQEGMGPPLPPTEGLPVSGSVLAPVESAKK